MFRPGMLRHPVETNIAATHVAISRRVRFAFLFSILPTFSHRDSDQTIPVVFSENLMFQIRKFGYVSARALTFSPFQGDVKKPNRCMSMSAWE
jgi:hypothetical protein